MGEVQPGLAPCHDSDQTKLPLAKPGPPTLMTLTLTLTWSVAMKYRATMATAVAVGATTATAVTLSLPLRQNRSTGQHSGERKYGLSTKGHAEYPVQRVTRQGCRVSASFIDTAQQPQIVKNHRNPLFGAMRGPHSNCWQRVSSACRSDPSPPQPGGCLHRQCFSHDVRSSASRQNRPGLSRPQPFRLNQSPGIGC